MIIDDYAYTRIDDVLVLNIHSWMIYDTYYYFYTSQTYDCDKTSYKIYFVKKKAVGLSVNNNRTNISNTEIFFTIG